MQKIFSRALYRYQYLSKDIPFSKCKPIVVSDIDGVLLRGQNPIPKTYQALHRLKSHNIPIACLTNTGGQTQQIKTQKLNKFFKEKFFDSELVFMNHTPLISILKNYGNKSGYILIPGSLDVKSVLNKHKIYNYATTDEIFQLLEDKEQIKRVKNLNTTATLKLYNKTLTKSEILGQLSSRLQISIDRIPKNYSEWALQINSIFALNEVHPYQVSFQCIHNILSQRNKQNIQQKLIYYGCDKDRPWASRYLQPRKDFRSFNRILKQHCHRNNFKLQHKYYGKPHAETFRFVEEKITSKIPEAVVFFMIGDNPKTDIRGANSIGWQSFLTKTGVYKLNQNDNDNPATFLVQDFSQAVQKIIQLNNLIRNHD